jgi:hypothetical protein
MDELWNRLWTDIVARHSGPMHLRVYLQPAMAAFFAIRDGMKDAKNGRPPYFWSVLTNSDERRALLKDGWKSVAKVFTMALIIDLIYQLFVVHEFHPGEWVIVAILLAIVPYVILRGPVNRLFSLGGSKPTGGTTSQS